MSEAEARLAYVGRLLDAACRRARVNGSHWDLDAESARLLALSGTGWQELLPDNAIGEPEPVLLTYAEAAARLRCAERSVRKLADGGQVPVVEVAGHPLIRATDLNDYIASLPLRSRAAAGAQSA